MRKILFFMLPLVAALLVVSCMTETVLSRLDRYEPVPSLSPAEVVDIQLKALRNNDEENRGIEIAFRFASPRNRETTGPLARFILLFYTPSFSPLLEAVSVEYPRIRISGRVAFQPVVLTDGAGEEYRYLFVLIRQTEDPYAECWMIEVVRPVSPGDMEEGDTGLLSA